MKSNLPLCRLCLLVAMLQLLLIVVSWLLSAYTGGVVRSLLSGEGIRWFFGGFESVVLQPPLLWLLLLLSAWGICADSGLVAHILSLIARPSSLVSRLSSLGSRLSSLVVAKSSSRQRLAFRVACAFLILYIAVILLLTLPSHAILLSAAGHLFPSPFSRSLVPIIAFAVIIAATLYGRLAGTLVSLSSAVASLGRGISRGATLLVLYILLIHFCASLHFVFCA